MPQKRTVAKVGGLLAFTALAYVWVQGVRARGTNLTLAGIPRYLGLAKDRERVKLPHFLNLVDDRTPLPDDILRSEKTIRSLKRAIDRLQPDVIDRHLSAFYHHISPMLEMQQANTVTHDFVTDMRGVSWFLLNHPLRARALALQWAISWAKQERVMPPEYMVIGDSIVAVICLYCSRVQHSERHFTSPREADQVADLIRRAELEISKPGGVDERLSLIDDMWCYVATNQTEVA